MDALAYEQITANAQTPDVPMVDAVEPHPECPEANVEHDAGLRFGNETVVLTPTKLIKNVSGDATPQQKNGAFMPQSTQFDPGAPLNPKSSDSSKQPLHAAPGPGPIRFDPRALLNPMPGKRPAEEADRGRANPPMGQVSLVERLHNVHERTASPAKRFKADNQRKNTSNGSNFGNGNALDLKQSNGQPPVAQAPQTQGPAIDLTMSESSILRDPDEHANFPSGDDDDVQIVEDNSNQIICIGKVKHTYIQAHTVPFPDPKKYVGNHGAQSRIKVSFRRSGGQKNNLTIMVADPTGKEFGKVDMKTAQGLAALMDSAKTNGMLWMSWTDPRRKAQHEGPSGSSFSGLLSMTTQLYCPRKHAHGIGKYLKSRGLELVDPLFELSKYDYYNPQAPERSFNKEQAPTFQPVPYSQSAAGSSSYVLRSVDEIREDVQNVFDTVVSTSETVPTREPSTHIKTELYPHQKQALYFMWDREQDHSGAEEDNRKDSLWKPHFRDNGRKSYIHIITGEEVTQKPKPCRGGILADEMGLGKTLSVLSLVSDMSSISDAIAFAEKQPPRLPQGSRLIQPLINSRATLLVCPLSTMTNWKDQIKDHFPTGRSALKWTRYHGTERFNVQFKDLADHDIVVTTYHIIAKDLLDKKRPLPYINWFRIVLDEAHMIRNPTGQSRAACSLPGQRRWAVTGTPVQNRLEVSLVMCIPCQHRLISGIGSWCFVQLHPVEPFRHDTWLQSLHPCSVQSCRS